MRGTYGMDNAKVDVEEEQQLKEYRALRSSFWIDDAHPSDLLEFPASATTWRLGPVFAERQFHDIEDASSEVSAACLASQVEGQSIGMQAIVKIRKQIPTGVETPNDVEPEDITRTTPSDYGPWASFEFYNLQRLTELGCSCTPQLLDFDLISQPDDDYVPGGFLLYLLMEKLPGRNLFNFGDLPMSERDDVRLAFTKSIRGCCIDASQGQQMDILLTHKGTPSEFYALKYKHKDESRRNLIWDSKNKKCYIIDLEAARELDDDAKPVKFRPAFDWFYWGLTGPSENSSHGVDPMVPFNDFALVESDDHVLQKMAADAAGKDLYCP